MPGCSVATVAVPDVSRVDPFGWLGAAALGDNPACWVSWKVRWRLVFHGEDNCLELAQQMKEFYHIIYYLL